ncbi:uncharacterized protein LOC117174937 [Belonocnema kinseyi]|uniref:uncharacterized protein LOC117174937 n=1 Tax=Belonocnema kinseyi TaxID=2817044 RepID=UPI00143DD134|nr:uncharacterized protein LOC117174937 [Belonocnema kinseyi]
MASVGSNYCILFAAVILFCVGNALPTKEPHPEALFDLLRNFEKRVIVEASFDKLVDETLPKIRGAIIANGLDPMELQEISLPVPGLPGVFKGQIDLNNGWLQHLSHVRRVGKSHLSYSDRKLTVEINVGWKDLTFDYQYLFKYLVVKRKGNVHGQVSDAVFQFVFVLDFDTAQIELQNVQFKNPGKYDLELEGHFSDRFLNAAVKVVANVAKNFITYKIQDIFQTVAQDKVDEINQILNPNIVEY